MFDKTIFGDAWPDKMPELIINIVWSSLLSKEKGNKTHKS
jgi:hypothetical protein